MIGCGCDTCTSADPRDTRLRPSIYLETAGARVLVDAGPDLRAQALRHRITRVDGILFTHGHADHILGMDDVRRFNVLREDRAMPGAMPCYGDAATLDDIRRMFSYVFDSARPKGGGIPQLDLRPIAGAFPIADLDVVPVPLEHGARPILGFRFDRFAYLTDCNRIPDASWSLLQGLDVLVLDALRIRPHPTHFSLEEAIATAGRIGARRTFFTHMCHDLLHAAIDASLPQGMALAYDGLVLELP